MPPLVGQGGLVDAVHTELKHFALFAPRGLALCSLLQSDTRLQFVWIIDVMTNSFLDLDARDFGKNDFAFASPARTGSDASLCVWERAAVCLFYHLQIRSHWQIKVLFFRVQYLPEVNFWLGSPCCKTSPHLFVVMIAAESLCNLRVAPRSDRVLFSPRVPSSGYSPRHRAISCMLQNSGAVNAWSTRWSCLDFKDWDFGRDPVSASFWVTPLDE